MTATRINVALTGCILALSGFVHGLFEFRQGDEPVPGLFIHAIGPEDQFWLYGTEPALTLLPTFYWAGLVTMAVSLVCAVWSSVFVHRRHGDRWFLSWFCLLAIVGGGIGHVLIFTMIWWFARYLHRPVGRVYWSVQFNGLWLPILVSGGICVLYALSIAVFGWVPGSNDPDVVSKVMLTSLALGVAGFVAAFLAGLSRDVQSGQIDSHK